MQTNTLANLRDSLNVCKWLLLFSHFAVRAVEGDELSFSSWTQIPENIIGGGKLQPVVRIIEAIYNPPPGPPTLQYNNYCKPQCALFG